MAKTKKAFFQPARTGGWYQAMTAEQAGRVIDRPDAARGTVYYIGGEQRAALGQVLSAPDSYNLVHELARRSAGVRHELASRMFDNLQASGPAGIGRYRTLTSLRLEAAMDEVAGQDGEATIDRLLSRHPDAPRQWFEPGFPETPADALDQQLQRARMIKFRHGRLPEQPMSDWQVRIQQNARTRLDAAITLGETLLDYGRNIGARGPGPARDLAAQALAGRLKPNELVRTVDDLNPHYGGAYDPYDGLSREEVRLHINAGDLAMRHWGEVNAEGRFGGGISIANGRQRFVPSSAIRDHGIPVPDRETLIALTTKPATPRPSAKVIPLRKP